MSYRGKFLVSRNFALTTVVAMVWAVWRVIYITRHQGETDTFAHPFPGWLIPRAIMICALEGALLGLFLARDSVGEDYPRMIALITGGFILLLMVVIPVLGSDVYGWQLFSLRLLAIWYVCLSHLAYGIIGSEDDTGD